MKSGKQRRHEIKQRRLQRAEKTIAIQRTSTPPHKIASMVMADQTALAHNNTYGLLPLFYLDRAFICRDCGAHELWTAKQQKWWYEVAKGPLLATAIRCRPCRTKLRKEKLKQRLRSEEGRRRKDATKDNNRSE